MSTVDITLLSTIHIIKKIRNVLTVYSKSLSLVTVVILIISIGVSLLELWNEKMHRIHRWRTRIVVEIVFCIFLHFWVGVCGLLPKTLTLFQTKICDFPCLIRKLIPGFRPSLVPLFRMMLKVLRITLVAGLNEERSIASPKKHTYTTRVQNPHPVWDQNGQNWHSISDQNVLKKPYALRLDIPV